MSLLIIADDLSGAADCAIGFASVGLSTVVALNPLQDVGDAQVVAVDTDTRRLSPQEAAERTAVAFEALIKPGQRLYKKIDSTLRGNWAAEVAALQKFAGLAIVSPAFPATGRTLRGGRVLVNGAPLESTDTWKLENADRPADVDAMLMAAGLITAQLPVDSLRGEPQTLAYQIQHMKSSGVQALIIDAETAEDLRTLATVTAGLDEALFWVGSGGLAREIATLPGLFQTTARDATTFQPDSLPTLVLVGSLSGVSERQCTMLKTRGGVTEMTVPPAVLRCGMRHADWAAWENRIGQHLRRGEDLLLRIGRDEAFDPAEGAHLSSLLAAMVKPHFAKVGGLIATGGETARAMLGAVGIGSLQLIKEIEAGVAFGRPIASKHGHRPGIITKAGAFGTDHALYAAWLHMSGATEPSAPAHAFKGSR
jgi:uncharacterized protein YgbK (DUF1537 family)